MYWEIILNLKHGKFETQIKVVSTPSLKIGFNIFIKKIYYIIYLAFKLIRPDYIS